MKTAKKILAATITAALLIVTPGAGVRQALADVLGANASAGIGRINAAPAAGVSVSAPALSAQSAAGMTNLARLMGNPFVAAEQVAGVPSISPANAIAAQAGLVANVAALAAAPGLSAPALVQTAQAAPAAAARRTLQDAVAAPNGFVRVADGSPFVADQAASEVAGGMSVDGTVAAAANALRKPGRAFSRQNLARAYSRAGVAYFNATRKAHLMANAAASRVLSPIRSFGRGIGDFLDQLGGRLTHLADGLMPSSPQLARAVRIGAVIPVATFAAWLLTGCGGGTPSVTPPPQPNGTPAPNATVFLQNDLNAHRFDPQNLNYNVDARQGINGSVDYVQRIDFTSSQYFYVDASADIQSQTYLIYQDNLGNVQQAVPYVDMLGNTYFAVAQGTYWLVGHSANGDSGTYEVHTAGVFSPFTQDRYNQDMSFATRGVDTVYPGQTTYTGSITAGSDVVWSLVAPSNGYFSAFSDPISGVRSQDLIVVINGVIQPWNYYGQYPVANNDWIVVILAANDGAGYYNVYLDFQQNASFSQTFMGTIDPSIESGVQQSFNVPSTGYNDFHLIGQAGTAFRLSVLDRNGSVIAWQDSYVGGDIFLNSVYLYQDNPYESFRYTLEIDVLTWPTDQYGNPQTVYYQVDENGGSYYSQAARRGQSPEKKAADAQTAAYQRSRNQAGAGAGSVQKNVERFLAQNGSRKSQTSQFPGAQPFVLRAQQPGDKSVVFGSVDTKKAGRVFFTHKSVQKRDVVQPPAHQ